MLTIVHSGLEEADNLLRNYNIIPRCSGQSQILTTVIREILVLTIFFCKMLMLKIIIVYDNLSRVQLQP